MKPIRYIESLKIHYRSAILIINRYLKQVGLNILGIVIVVGLVNIYLMIPTFIVVYVSYKLSDFYLSTSRSIKRLEGISEYGGQGLVYFYAIFTPFQNVNNIL